MSGAPFTLGRSMPTVIATANVAPANLFAIIAPPPRG
jgi:hypothetical protein